MSNTSIKNSGYSETVREWAQRIFLIGLVPSVALLAYLLYGLFSGQLAGSLHTHEERLHAIQLVNQLSGYLNIALVIALVSSLFLFFEVETLGVTLLLLAGFLSYGVRFASDFLHIEESSASAALFSEFRLAAMIIGAPGVALVVKDIIARIISSRYREDLTIVTYGKDVPKQHERPTALIGAFAACWQLPFCRDNIRVSCPIFHARTKCWQQRVGCMCEENIILLAMGNEKEQPHDMTAGSNTGGFVPIGDLLTQNVEKTRAAIPMRTGPRGVRLPDNPHLSDAAKRERCRNCVIYNEHQRQKFGFLSGPVTIAVPALVFWQYPALLTWLGDMLSQLDGIIARLSFTGQPGAATEVTKTLQGNVFVETVLIICMTLVLMTWAQRLLEYAVYKIKI